MENVFNFLRAADQHNASKLKGDCLTFMASNFSQVVKTEDWKQFCIDEGELVAEVTCAIGKLLVSKTSP